MGTPPTSGRSSAGALPAGLHLQASTGTIVGKPKAAGISTFTVQAVDTKDKVKPTTQNSGTATLSLQVVASPEGMPASGLYATPQYAAGQIAEYTVQYSSAPDADGVVSPLLMDIYVPPGTPRGPGRRSSRSTGAHSSAAAAPTRTGTPSSVPCTATWG